MYDSSTLLALLERCTRYFKFDVSAECIKLGVKATGEVLSSTTTYPPSATLTLELFARKLLDPSSSESVEKVVQNEVRAVKKLCQKNENENIIKVLRAGKLASSPHYFIDMELSDINLETYILQNTLEEVDPLKRPQQVLAIMLDISNAVTFIHAQGEIHRGLKPQNGQHSAHLTQY